MDASATAKSAMVESSTCSKSRLSKVYRNVTLRDGINSGEFTDRGSITNMDDCVKQCCADDNCNVAFVIKETCFTVKCKNYDTCSLKSAMSQYYNPRIAYVNWSPPKENLGEGSCHLNLYAFVSQTFFLQCSLDFRMELALRLKDPLLNMILRSTKVEFHII